MIVALDYVMFLAIALLWRRTMWMKNQLSPQPPVYAAGEEPKLSASWTADQQAVSENWCEPPLELQTVLQVGARVEHEKQGLGSVTAVSVNDPGAKPYKIGYDSGVVVQYSASQALKLKKKANEDDHLLEVEGHKAPLKPDAGHGHADGHGHEHTNPMAYLYFGLHEGEEKLQVVLTTGLLLSCTYISVLFCVLFKTLLDIHWAVVIAGILPIVPQMMLFFLTMRNFSLCGCLEYEINNPLKNKIARTCKLRKTIDQLHRLVQLKDLAMHVYEAGDTAKDVGEVAMEDIDPSERRKLHDLFVLVDADGSGEITGAELTDALSTLGKDLDEKSISKLVSLMDKDGSGDIGFAEFACVLEGLKHEMAHEVALNSTEFVTMLFSIFDDDGAGTITFDEMAAVLQKFGSWDMTELSELFREMDSEGGGEVDMKEFKHFLAIVLEG